MNRSRHHFFSCPKGFTLIELLLGLLIFSIIALSLYSVFATGLNVNRRFKLQGELDREMRWVFEQMAKDLENSVAYDFSASYPDVISFRGEKTKLQCLTVTSDGLKMIRYYLAEPDNTLMRIKVGGKMRSVKNSGTTFKKTTRCLIREEQSLPAYLAKDEDDVRREVLSFDVEDDGLVFSYKARFKNKDAMEIQQRETWEEVFLPSVVHAALLFNDPSSKEETFVVARDLWIPAGGSGD